MSQSVRQSVGEPLEDAGPSTPSANSARPVPGNESPREPSLESQTFASGGRGLQGGTQPAQEETAAAVPTRRRKYARKPLKGGKPRKWGDHRREPGRLYDAYWAKVTTTWNLDGASLDVAADLCADQVELVEVRAEIERLKLRTRKTLTVKADLRRARRRERGLVRDILAHRKTLGLIAERRATRVPSIAELFSEVAPR
jgi:hypothetical protein